MGIPVGEKIAAWLQSELDEPARRDVKPKGSYELADILREYKHLFKDSESLNSFAEMLQKASKDGNPVFVLVKEGIPVLRRDNRHEARLSGQRVSIKHPKLREIIEESRREKNPVVLTGDDGEDLLFVRPGEFVLDAIP